jgi:hypothetical protein
MMRAAQWYVPLYNVYEYQDQSASGDGFGMLTFTGTPRPVLAEAEAIIRQALPCPAVPHGRSWGVRAGLYERCPR